VGIYWFQEAKKKGIRIISVDPCYTDTAKMLGAEWIAIRPSTDTAMLIAMAYVLIVEELYDKKYIERYVYGFEKYKDYVLGKTDGVAKTPEWAAGITGVSAEEICRLAREYAAARPAALIQGWAPGRTANGEQYHRAAIAFQAMTGNIGVSGGSGSCGAVQYTGGPNKASLLQIISSQLLLEGTRLTFGGKGVEIQTGKWADAVLRGKEGGYPSDIKMIYVVGHNIINQRQNVKKGVEAFKKVDFVVCHEQFLTPTARHSDIVLPVTTNFERNDISIPWAKGYYVVFANKIVEPLWDTKSDLDITKELAIKLGLSEFEDKSADDLLQERFEKSLLKDYTTYEDLREKGLLRMGEEPVVRYQKQIEDPDNNPFPTPSGKIEIYSRRLDEENFDTEGFSSAMAAYKNIPRIPTFIECEELPDSKTTRKYSLQLTTPHPKYRVHSQLYNIPKLRKLYEHTIWINPADAEGREVKDGDLVRVFNDRGAILVRAKVTERIREGVVRCSEGTWYDPDEEGIDRGLCVNVLIDDMLTSSGGTSNFNTCLVEIKKEKERN